MWHRLRIYFQDLKREFQRINWPNRSETVKMSLVVITLSLVVAAYLGLLDFLFSTLLKRLVS
jgi:preprotein translocase subunit SecE